MKQTIEVSLNLLRVLVALEREKSRFHPDISVLGNKE